MSSSSSLTCRVFAVLLSFLLFTSCEQTVDGVFGIDGMYYMQNTTNKFDTVDEAGRWIADNILYETSDPYEWKSPHDIEQSRKGMCVDYCTLLMWYAHSLGIDSEMVKVLEYDGKTHALVRMNGVLIEAQAYAVRCAPYVRIVETYSFNEVIDKIYYQYGNRGVQ